MSSKIELLAVIWFSSSNQWDEGRQTFLFLFWDSFNISIGLNGQLDFWSSWSFPNHSLVVATGNKQRKSNLNYCSTLARKKKKVWLYYFFTLQECCESILLTSFSVISYKKQYVWCPRSQRLHRYIGSDLSRSQCSSTVCRAQQHPETRQAFPVWTAPMDGMSPRCAFPLQLHSTDVHTVRELLGWGQVLPFTIFKLFKIKKEPWRFVSLI